MKPVLANAALSGASLVMALLVAEAALRLTGYLPGNPLERLINHPDAFLGYRMIPGRHETIPGPDGVYTAKILDLGFEDGAGFRDDGVSLPVGSVFIGDSFVWGFGVELADSISERYEALSGADAVNLGMTSWTSPTQYARILQRYAVPLRPRLVFVEALVENDFGDGPNFAAWEASGSPKSYPEWMTDRVMHYQPDSIGYKLRRLLYDHSAIGRLVSDRIQFGFRDAERPGEDALIHVTANGLDLYLDRRALAGPDADATQVNLFRSALASMRSTAAASGMQLVVFIVPTKELVYQERFPDQPSRTAVDWRYQALRQVLSESGVAWVDLLPPLRAAAARGKQLYFTRDTHWTALGHDVAARALRDFATSHCTAGGCSP